MPRDTIARQRGVQNKKYNGKEFIEAHGLDEYDSQARMYYPAIMRTTTPVLLSVSIKVTEVWRSLQTTSELKSGLCLENKCNMDFICIYLL